MSRVGRSGRDELLLGEWACLAILYSQRSHGFAIAALLRPDAEIGRVWSLSRPLTYRALEQLTARELIEPVAAEPGDAGPNRTVLAATKPGRAAVRRWLRTPVAHLRDLRSELLLKLVLADRCAVDIGSMLREQRDLVAAQVAALAMRRDDDVVALWRHESSIAALAFLDQVTGAEQVASG